MIPQSLHHEYGLRRAVARWVFTWALGMIVLPIMLGVLQLYKVSGPVLDVEKYGPVFVDFEIVSQEYKEFEKELQFLAHIDKRRGECKYKGVRWFYRIGDISHDAPISHNTHKKDWSRPEGKQSVGWWTVFNVPPAASLHWGIFYHHCANRSWEIETKVGPFPLDDMTDIIK